MLYRVDKRKFQVGEEITPNTSFEEILQDEKREMEKLLNQQRPSGIPERKQCLFLFQDLICALRFYSKYGGFIYGVSVKEPYFKGDMNKLDNILDLFRFTDNYDLQMTAVNEYWKDGTHTFSPCYEILAASAYVESILAEENLLSKLKQELIYAGNSIEKTATYKSLLQKI